MGTKLWPFRGGRRLYKRNAASSRFIRPTCSVKYERDTPLRLRQSKVWQIIFWCLTAPGYFLLPAKSAFHRCPASGFFTNHDLCFLNSMTPKQTTLSEGLARVPLSSPKNAALFSVDLRPKNVHLSGLCLVAGWKITLEKRTEFTWCQFDTHANIFLSYWNEIDLPNSSEVQMFGFYF